MVKAIGKIALFSIFASTAMYAVNLASCTGCHGANFEKKALGVSKIVKDMSKEEIIKALKGYKNGTYGGPMKSVMIGQVKNLSDADIEEIANLIKSGDKKAAASSKAEAPKKGVKELDNEHGIIKAPDLKKAIPEEKLSYRQTNLYKEDGTTPPEVKFDAPPPGAAQRIARSYENAPPLIPHSVEGLVPITIKHNACLDCHMPDKAKAVGATPIPPSHFVNYRPTTVYKNGELVKEGKTVGLNGQLGNVGDIKLAKAKKLSGLYPGRYNCTQCHVPQANTKPLVKNNFKPEFKDSKLKEKSNLVDVIDEGVK
jgi:cytochrome c-type protein NapB